MNESIRATMQRELADSRKGFGVAVGIGCFVGLYSLATIIPGVAELMKNHAWPIIVMIILSMGAGGFADQVRNETIRAEIEHLDDDTLKFRHDAMSRKKLKGDVIFCIVIALIAAYFIFRN